MTTKICPSCRGTGKASEQKSTEINGKIYYYYPSCSACNGSGKIVDKN